MTLPPILHVADVMERYAIRDERTARKVMNEAGAFKVAGRLIVREDVLDAHERRQAAPASHQRVRDAATGVRRRGLSGGSGASPTDGPDWWRADASAPAAA